MSVDHGFNCPAGGKWYACSSGSHFVGCCGNDPCSNGLGCAQGDLVPGAFNISSYTKFPDASCDKGSNFYSCKAGKTFWGCCKTDACAATPAASCAQGNLTPAFMSRPEQFNAYAPSQPSSSTKSHSGTVVGAAVGGGVGLALIIGIIIFIVCRGKKRRQQQNKSDIEPPMKSLPLGRGEEQTLPQQYGGLSPPPQYASPNPDFYFFPKGQLQQSQHYPQSGHQVDGPSELPGKEVARATEHRYSELATGETMNGSTAICSELPGNAILVASELESPQASPRPVQSKFPTDLVGQTRAN